MNISSMHINDNKMLSDDVTLLKRFLSSVTTYSEYLWFGITFILFLLMGPFSIIAVVIGLWNLASGEQVKGLAEPIKG